MRKRIFIGLFFCLISLGQAYSYASIMAMGQEMQCGCNLAGRKCIHGCHLKNHQDPQWARQVNAKDRASTWVNPHCAQQKIREALSIQGDPFLPQVFRFALVPDRLAFDLTYPTKSSFEIFLPFERPPKIG